MRGDMTEQSVQGCGLQDHLILESVIFICEATLKGKCSGTALQNEIRNVTALITADEFRRGLQGFL